MSELHGPSTDLERQVALQRARLAMLERDNAELRGAQQALRESRTRLRTVVANAPIVLFALNGEGRFTLSEGKALEVLGLKPGEVVGRSVYEVYNEAPAILADATRALAGEAFTSRVELPQAVFETRWTPMIDASGNAEGCIGVATDVTDTHRAARQLRDSEQRFRMLAENIPGVIYLCRNDARYSMLYLSDAVEKLTGYPKQAFLDDKVSFVELYHPEDAPKIAPLVEEALNRREPFHLIYRIERRDGGFIWVEEWGAGLFEDGELVYLEGYLTDITARIRAEQAAEKARDELEARVIERTAKLKHANEQLHDENKARQRIENNLRESESRFRQLAENIDAVFWLVGPLLDQPIYVSPAFERIYGRAIDDAYKPDGWLECVHPDDRDRVAQRFKKYALEGRYAEEYRIVLPDGAVRHIRDRGFPIKNQGGQVYRVAGVAHDITDQKLSEQRERENQAALAHVLRVASVGEMASGLAHELNQPLGAVVNYAKGCVRRVASGDFTAEQLAEAMDKIVTQAERASDILRRVRQYITPTESSRELIDLNAVVFDTLKLAEVDLSRGRVHVEHDLASTMPPVRADRVQIEQVILNIVRNGIDAVAGRDDRRLFVQTQATTDPAGRPMAQVSITDTGPGLSEDPERLFEPFYTNKSSGLGMGLSISRSIMEQHRGRIWGTSQTGRGATFHLTLPAEKGAR